MSMTKYKQLLLDNDPNTLAQAFHGDTWIPLDKQKNPSDITVALNEFLFDIDDLENCGYWGNAKKLAQNIIEVLEEMKIPFWLMFSGRYFHISVFFNPKVGIPRGLLYAYGRNGIPFRISKFAWVVKRAVFLYMISKIERVPRFGIDTQPTLSSSHMIRICGGKHPETGQYKTLLKEIPKKRPKVKKEDVIYPKKIEYWDVPDSMMYKAFKLFVKIPTKEEETKKIKIDSKTILSRVYRDGRKRIVLKLLAPLLRVEGKKETEAKKIVKKWLEKNYSVYPSNSGEPTYKIVAWAKCVVAWAYNRKNWKPSDYVLNGLKFEVLD